MYSVDFVIVNFVERVLVAEFILVIEFILVVVEFVLVVIEFVEFVLIPILAV
jgi:hypothetical protein